MITCPFCGKPVYRSHDERDTNCMVENDSIENFYCPTYVNMTQGVRWCHYQRTTNPYAHYSAVIPPFLILWKLDGNIQVSQITKYDPDRVTESYLIYETKTDDFDEFIRVCNRFKNLVAFS